MMGLQIRGWIEIQIPRYGQQWNGVVNVDNLVMGRLNEIFIHLFGIRPSGARVEDELHPLAAARGIPPGASPEVREWDPDEVATGYRGYTWILWSELEHTPWSQGVLPSGELAPSNWRMLFDLMALLAKEYGSDHVRIVAWFV